MDASGALTKIPGPAFHWFAMDETNRFAGTRLPAGAGWELQRAGSSPTLLLSSDYPITRGTDGNLYYSAPAPGGGGVQLMRLDPSGASSVFNLPAQATGKRLLWLKGLAAGPDGSLRIRRLSPEGKAKIVARIDR
jgi:hypothetical protein